MWARVIIVAPNATVGVARKWSVPSRGDFAGDARLLGQQIMKDETKLTPLQRWRTRAHLLLTALRKRLTVGVRAVLLDGRKVLLVKHTYTPGWQFPGGGVEPGETAETAAAREALEETGYAVDGRPVLHGLFLNRIAGGKRDHVAVYIWRDFRSQLEFVPISKSPNAAGSTSMPCRRTWERARRGGYARSSRRRNPIPSGETGRIVTEWSPCCRLKDWIWRSRHDDEALAPRP